MFDLLEKSIFLSCILEIIQVLMKLLIDSFSLIYHCKAPNYLVIEYAVINNRLMRLSF